MTYMTGQVEAKLKELRTELRCAKDELPDDVTNGAAATEIDTALGTLEEVFELVGIEG